MGFRGVLLCVRDGEHDKCFHVVSPDASLQLPVSGVARDKPHITTQKIVVTDYITSELLQVARLSTVLVQRATRSILWVAIVSAESSGEPLAGSTFALDPRALVKRICYCFHFQADIDFETFERAQQTAQRVQNQSMLETSVLMELEIRKLRQFQPKPMVLVKAPEPVGHKELKQRREELRRELKATEDEKKQAEKIRRQADEMAALRAKAKAAEANKLAAGRAPKASSPSGASTSSKKEETEPPATTQCILCGSDDRCRSVAGTFVKHPYVLKDGKNQPVIVCKVCVHRVLKRKLAWDGSRGANATRDALCGLCADPVNAAEVDAKACSHPQCPRVYCDKCLKILFGKAQVKKVYRTKNWFCPNCTTPDDVANITEKVEAAEQVAEKTAAESNSKRKRKRSNEPVIKDEKNTIPIEDPTDFVVDVDKVVAVEPGGKTMTVLDYAVTYFEFLTQCEAQSSLPKESEDSCFCCKDGGDLMECDFRHGKLRCLKVYHSDCLGYSVPDDEKWICPRHRCYKCGFSAQYACRFCVTSFCKEHMLHNLKELGPGTAEIRPTTYVLCGSCDYVLMKAVEKGKISATLYDSVLHPAKPKSKKRS